MVDIIDKSFKLEKLQILIAIELTNWNSYNSNNTKTTLNDHVQAILLQQWLHKQNIKTVRTPAYFGDTVKTYYIEFFNEEDFLFFKLNYCDSTIIKWP